jgi:predicted RNA-binding protein
MVIGSENKAITLTGGDELFQEPRFLDHYQFMLKEYEPRRERPIAFFMSCSKHKPFYTSPYRRIFKSMLKKKLAIRRESQIYTVSEPAIIVPEELDGTAVSYYDFPPEKLQQEGKKIFIRRLTAILPKLLKNHRYSFYVLPKHHRVIFETALQKVYQQHEGNGITRESFASRIIYVPPVIYNLPKVRTIIRETLKGTNIFVKAPPGDNQ